MVLMESHKPNTVEVNLSGKRVAIATPCYGNSVVGNYLMSMVAAIPDMLKCGVDYDVMTVPNESIVSRARNTLTKMFINRKDCTHLMFIDADMGWKSDAILRLLASGKDFIGAAGPRKELPLTYCANFDIDNYKTCEKTGLLTVNEIGTGFLMLSRECIEKIMASEPDNFYADSTTGEKTHNLFENKIIDGKFWSEDYVFSKKWKNIGGEVWVDPMIELEHVGTHTYKGAFIQALKGEEGHA